MIKTCFVCHEEKDVTKFVANKRNTSWECKACKRERSRTHYQKHRLQVIERTLLYQQTHPETRAKKYSTYAKNHPGVMAAKASLRRARLLKATPKWLTKEQLNEMKQFYINCPTGYEVDHIHPLKGDGFSGLHVPWNLQYLPASENSRKGNRLYV